MLEQSSILLPMNTRSLARRAAIVRALVDGSSIRSIARVMQCDKDTVTRLLVEVGEFCSIYQHCVLVNLPCKRVEADEIWSFVGAKAKNATNTEQGDIWTYTAICKRAGLQSISSSRRTVQWQHRQFHECGKRCAGTPHDRIRVLRGP